MHALLEFTVYGALLGTIYGLLAMPMGMLYATIHTVDIAVGSYATIAGITALLIGGVAGIVLGLVAGVALSLVVATIFQLMNLRGVADPIAVATASFGVLLAIESLMLLFAGPDPMIHNPFGAFWSVLGLQLNPISVISLVLALFAVLLLSVMLHKSSIGRQLRASADNVRGARMVGIRVRKLQYFTFATQGLLAATAGILIAHSSGLDFGSALRLSLAAFAAAAIFGLRGPVWCLAGGIVFGIVEGLVAGFSQGGIATIIPYLFVIGVLLSSPRLALAGRP